MRSLFENARLILPPGEGIPDGSLLAEDGVIVDILPSGRNRPVGSGMVGVVGAVGEVDQVIDMRGDFLAPGLVDIHCHGAAGRDAMEADPEAFDEILRQHAFRGTTTVLLTTVAAPMEEMLGVLRCAATRRHGAGGSKLAGVHLEGPYFSPRRRGAHREEALRLPSPAETSLLAGHSSILRRMTLAPELPGSIDLVRELCRRGISCSAGHSDATEGEAREGFAAGITQVTHLHNAMSSLRKSGRPGLAEAALSASGILCELIADGIHVSPGLLAEAWRLKGWEGIVLVSDATAGAGLGDAESFDLGGLPCRIEDGAAWTGSGDGRRLAGSTEFLFRGIRTMTREAGVPLEQAVAMATLVPARSLRLDHEIGVLKVGNKADLIRFDAGWNLHGVWIDGVKAAGW